MKILCLSYIVYRKESFPSEESDTKILQSIYFAYLVIIISSHSNRTCLSCMSKINDYLLLGAYVRCQHALFQPVVAHFEQDSPHPATQSCVLHHPVCRAWCHRLTRKWYFDTAAAEICRRHICSHYHGNRMLTFRPNSGVLLSMRTCIRKLADVFYGNSLICAGTAHHRQSARVRQLFRDRCGKDLLNFVPLRGVARSK